MLSARRTSSAQRQCPAAQGLDFGLEGRQRGRVAAGDHQVRPGPGQRPAEVLAQPAAGAGDDGDLAGEIKRVVVHISFAVRASRIRA